MHYTLTQLEALVQQLHLGPQCCEKGEVQSEEDEAVIEEDAMDIFSSAGLTISLHVLNYSNDLNDNVQRIRKPIFRLI